MTASPASPISVSLTVDGVLTISPWREVTKDEAFKIIDAVAAAVQPILMASQRESDPAHA